MSNRKPSPTSLIAFLLLACPLVYVLSYAPVVRVFERSVERRIYYSVDDPEFAPGTLRPEYSVDEIPAADGSLYPAYEPVDWLIENTPLRRPLFFWADIWGVRDAFEHGELYRAQNRHASSGETARSGIASASTP